jgi:hypothetical protein
MSTRLFLLFTVVGWIGCSGPASVDGDAINDNLPAGGKADTAGLTDGTPEAAAILQLVNTASAETLKGAVGLSAQAADNIYAVRIGDDEQPGTDDDVQFATLAELDAVPYVGPRAFRAMLAYVKRNGLVDAPSAPVADESDPAFDPASCTGSRLTETQARGVFSRFAVRRLPQFPDFSHANYDPVDEINVGTFQIVVRSRNCSGAGCSGWRIERPSGPGWSGPVVLRREFAGTTEIYTASLQTGQNGCDPWGPVCEAGEWFAGDDRNAAMASKLRCDAHGVYTDVPEVESCVSDPSNFRLGDGYMIWDGLLTDHCLRLTAQGKTSGTAWQESEAAVLVQF